MNALTMLAEGTAVNPTVDASTLTTEINGLLSGIFTLENLIAIIGTALGLCAGFFIFHFGYKFIKGKVVSALKKGRL